MSGEALKQEIRKGAEDKANLVLSGARAKAEQIISEAMVEAKRTLETRTQDAQRRLEQVERSEAAKSRMECTKRVLGVQSRYIEQAFSGAESMLNSLPSTNPARYRDALVRFVEEGSQALGGSSLVAVVREVDKKLVEEILRSPKAEHSSRISISTEGLKSSGGVVLRTEDEKAYFVNTLESRMLRARDELRAKVTATLLGGESS